MGRKSVFVKLMGRSEANPNQAGTLYIKKSELRKCCPHLKIEIAGEILNPSWGFESLDYLDYRYAYRNYTDFAYKSSVGEAMKDIAYTVEKIKKAQDYLKFRPRIVTANNKTDFSDVWRDRIIKADLDGDRHDWTGIKREVFKVRKGNYYAVPSCEKGFPVNDRQAGDPRENLVSYLQSGKSTMRMDIWERATLCELYHLL